MNLKSILLSTLIASTPLLATAKPLVPNRCPSVEAIKSVPMDKVVGDWVFGAMAYNSKPNNYDTNDGWTMVVVAGKDVENEAEALIVANENLSKVTMVQGPGQDGDQWFCFYGMGEGKESEAIGWAINPPHEGLVQRISRIRR